MKVVLLLLDVDRAGDRERSFLTLARALAAAGQQVVVLSILRSSEQPSPLLDPRIEVQHLIDVRAPGAPRPLRDDVDPELAARLHAVGSVLVPSHWDDQLSGLADVLLEAALGEIGADVVVTEDPTLLAAAAQVLPASCSLVHQEHGWSADDSPIADALRFFAPRADAVVVPTEAARTRLGETLGPSAPPVVVVPPALEQGFRPRATLESRVVVASGPFTMDKQHSRLVEAFGEVADRVPGWRLRLVGDGAQRRELVRAVRRLGLWNRVELPGEVPDTASAWALASVSVVPSRSEAFPLSALEAMAAGVPVVAFDNPSGNRALVRHEENGLLVGSASTSGLASALLRLMGDDALRLRLGTAALQTSRAYSAETIARTWLEVLSDAVQRRDQTPGRLLRRLGETSSAATARSHGRARPVDDPTGAPTTPAEARGVGLAWAVDCARRTSEHWFLIPPHGGHSATVVIPMADRARFLDALAGPGAPAWLCAVDTAGGGWPERVGPLDRLPRELVPVRTVRISLQPWPDDDVEQPGVLSSGSRTDVEFWEAAPDGTLVSSGPNPFVSRVPHAPDTVEVEVEGVLARTLPLMTEPTVHDCRFPVDAVYTWVDGDDPAWDAARRARLARMQGVAHSRTSSGRARFVSRDELRYSLRSLHLFAPWIRTIHLVTAGQTPDWLVAHPRIRVVDHREILPADALPTFNSHAIESGLHRIEGLAEHFVYLNDDFLLGRPLEPRRFFTAAGQPRVFFSHLKLGVDDTPDAAPWLRAAWNNRRLLQEEFGAVITHSLMHAPYAHRVSVLREIEERWPAEVAATAHAPFRSESDLSLLSSFAQHYGLLTGTAVEAEARTAYVDISASDVVRRLKGLQAREQDFICLGDHHDHALNPVMLQQALEGFYTTYFPTAAPWEAADPS